MAAREIEKKRIREKILMEEFVRRRELEEEVTRELILEGKIAVQRPDRLSMLASPCLSMGLEMRGPLVNPLEGNHTEIGGLPFQRDPKVTTGSAAVKPIFNLCKDETVPLVKPVSNAAAATAGTKRKFETSADSEEMFLATKAKKKVQVDWTCALCQVRATSEANLNMHLNGKKHNKAKERASIQPAATKDKETALAQTAPTNATKAASKEPTNELVEAPTGPANKFWCTLCNVGAANEAEMNAHKMGKPHLRQFIENAGSLANIEPVPGSVCNV